MFTMVPRIKIEIWYLGLKQCSDNESKLPRILNHPRDHLSKGSSTIQGIIYLVHTLSFSEKITFLTLCVSGGKKC